MYSSGYKNRSIEKNGLCRFYRNLNNGQFSVLCKEKKHEFNNKVVGHFDDILIELTDDHPRAVISKSGQDRARKMQTRNVHCWVQGRIVGVNDQVRNLATKTCTPITYNPFINDNFILKIEQTEWNPQSATHVLLSNNQAFAITLAS
ncbi:hypothetical protein [Vibrio barjaei]|uniref:hypothetical protein n=1 Tax=Vibrio barjaei TaxID=1676683 RepID=UPI0022841612|nr:hypothetical protein [Vibrio barjaei]MCY9872999.1 hypothetical protein [Vibrio barjaei]